MCDPIKDHLAIKYNVIVTGRCFVYESWVIVTCTCSNPYIDHYRYNTSSSSTISSCVSNQVQQLHGWSACVNAIIWDVKQSNQRHIVHVGAIVGLANVMLYNTTSH